MMTTIMQDHCYGGPSDSTSNNSPTNKDSGSSDQGMEADSISDNNKIHTNIEITNSQTKDAPGEANGFTSNRETNEQTYVLSQVSLKKVECTRDLIRNSKDTLNDDSLAKIISLSDEHQLSSNITKDLASTDEKAVEIETSNTKTDEQIYKCGVCLNVFQTMLQLHEHMVNVEKVKSYKYNTEDRITTVDEESEQVKLAFQAASKSMVKKRGRKRKQDIPDITEKDKRSPTNTLNKDIAQKKKMSNNKNSLKKGFDVDSINLNEQSLVKFEKTVELQDEKSAFFDTVSHSYGTRRSSFLKLKEYGSSPDKHKTCAKSKGMEEEKANEKAKQGVIENCSIDEMENYHGAESYKMGVEEKEHDDLDAEKSIHENAIDDTVEAKGLDCNTEDMLKTNENFERLKPDGTTDFEEVTGNKTNLCEDKKNLETPKQVPRKKKGDGSYFRTSYVDCKICGKTFRRCFLQRHMTKHSTKREWQCNICQKFYKTKVQCEDHKKKTHSNPDVAFQCSLCLRILKSRHNAEKHKTLHLFKGESPEFEILVRSDQEYLELDARRSTEEKKEHQQEHLRTEKEEEDDDDDEEIEKELNKEEAAKVEETIVNKERIKLESENGKSGIHDCAEEKAFIDAKSLKTRKLEHISEKQHTCKVCSKVYKKLYRLIDHMESVHSNTKFECDICNMSLSTNRSLWAHKGRHLSPTDKYYTEEVAKKIREEHKEKLKSNRSPKFVICPVCGKDILSKRLSRHMQSHNTSRDFECDICHKRFTTKRYANDHKVKSHGNKTSFCDICGRTFKGTGYLEKHKQTHGPKDKICKLCGKGFTTALYLKVHMYTHAEEKFKCTMCEASFKHKARLDIHIVERHSKGQDRPCKHCGMLFPSRQKARFHERKVHEGYIPIQSRRRTSFGPKTIQVQDVTNVQGTTEEAHNRITIKTEPNHAENVEQIIEIPENSQQCQLMILPNGVIKVLNVIEDDGETCITEESEDNITIQYVTEDGSQVVENGEPEVQYIELNESEFKLITEGKSDEASVTHSVE